MRNPESIGSLIPCLLCAAMVLAASMAHAGNVRVNVSSDGGEANDWTWYPAVSDDGRVAAFQSRAENLVDGDDNGTWDVFLHDLETGETTRANIASDGTQANDISQIGVPALSADGRFVVFSSRADNLVAGDGNRRIDVFVHDRETRETTRASVGRDGAEANGNSFNSGISANGRYVTFESDADNLVPGDNNGVHDVFLFDRETGSTTRVNVASDGTEADAGSTSAWIWNYTNPVSDDGRFVAFTSPAGNLVPDDNNYGGEPLPGNYKTGDDVFVRDLEKDETTRVSVASDGSEGNGYSLLTSMSGDGRYFVFVSSSSNFAAGDCGIHGGSFVHDRETGQTTCGGGTLSGDGSYLAFSARSADYAEWDESAPWRIFVRDMESGETLVASRAFYGGETNASSGSPMISRNGRYLAFTSGADNLVPGDNNAESDAFVTENPHLFRINAGLNDAWHSPDIPGQGFQFTVFPESRRIFLSWMTFDTERPDESIPPGLGGPGQRWLSAYGSYSGHTALLEIYVTTGGVFASPEPEPLQYSDGAMRVRFTACTAGTIEYHIPSIDRMGLLPIQRVSLENVALCELLQDLE